MKRRLLPAGDPRLRRPCARIETAVTNDVRQLVADLAETMYANRGLGLAAPQVGVMLRAFVVDVRDAGGLQTFINPEIIARDGEAIGDDRPPVRTPDQQPPRSPVTVATNPRNQP